MAEEGRLHWENERRRLADLRPQEDNPRYIGKDGANRLETSWDDYGQIDALAVGPDGSIYNGHQRYYVLLDRHGPDFEVDVRVASRSLSRREWQRLTVLLHEGAVGDWDFDGLANWDGVDVGDLVEWGFDEASLLGHAVDLNEATASEHDEAMIAARATLAERFIVPPFSVLDARQGYWQNRKRAWLALGIKSELGRGKNLGGIPSNEEDILHHGDSYGASPRKNLAADRKHPAGAKGSGGPGTLGKQYGAGARPPHGPSVRQNPDGTLHYDPTNQGEGVSGTSVFDPVLCELAYSWWTAPGFHILDPFAGGSVRGIVAGYLGRQYTGIELRAEQIAANAPQWDAIVEKRDGKPTPNWISGDSSNVRELVGGPVDFIFSCPPYYNLEIYSDLEGELSAYKTYEEFLQAYRTIIMDCVALLRPNRFACFVVGDLRGKDGHYHNFVSDTIAAFRDAGMGLYNEAILVTAIGSLSIRVPRQFDVGRKLGKTHQNVLIFVKGDWRQTVEECGMVEIVFEVESAAV